jgi:hypothetical protein
MTQSNEYIQAEGRLHRPDSKAIVKSIVPSDILKVRLEAVAKIAWQEATDPQAALHVAQYISGPRERQALMTQDFLLRYLGEEAVEILNKAATLRKELQGAIQRKLQELDNG